MRTLELDTKNNAVHLIDQRKLPSDLEILTLHSCKQISEAIYSMAVRGAPAIGVAAAFGLALTCMEYSKKDKYKLIDQLQRDAEMLVISRPTAINLLWAVEKMMAAINPAQSANDIQSNLIKEAQKIADDDVKTNKQMAENGAALINDGDVIIHHCNTGALAAVEWGTALGCIRFAHEQGKKVHVLVDETRPRLQGARLTAWELEQYGIPYEVICDGAAGYMIRRGLANKVMFGADRVTANGDVVNKVGTYMLALAAHENQLPVICVFPTSSYDPNTVKGDDVQIEMRPEQEILGLEFQGKKVFPINAKALNPAFDITPSKLITHMVTERGIITPPFNRSIVIPITKTITETHK